MIDPVLTQTTITLNLAEHAMREILLQAKAHDVSISVSVVNACGQLIHMSHMDNAPLLCREIALNKALTAVSFGIPTHKWSERLELCSPAVRQGLPL